MPRMRYEREEIATGDFRATREYLEVDTDEYSNPYSVGPDGEFLDCDPEDFDEIAGDEEERHVIAEETAALGTIEDATPRLTARRSTPTPLDFPSRRVTIASEIFNVLVTGGFFLLVLLASRGHY